MLKLLNAQTGTIIYNLTANSGTLHILKRATNLYFLKSPLLTLHSYHFSSNQTSQEGTIKILNYRAGQTYHTQAWKRYLLTISVRIN